MDNLQLGAELGKISGLLFDAVARKWQAALALEIAAGVIGAILAVWGPDGRIGLAGTALGFLCLAIAYGLRLRAEVQYDTAETMRRQSVFTDGLDWPVSDWQIARWRQRVGKRIRELAQASPRPDDYFATRKLPGAQRLAEMTIESAFYTHYQYCLLRTWILRILVVVALASLGALMLPLFFSDSTDEVLGRTLYALLPVVFALDLIGWWLRFGRTLSNLESVQKSLEELRRTTTGDTNQVLRVVAEYDSQVANGFPLPSWLFDRWHAEIRAEWKRYSTRLGIES